MYTSTLAIEAWSNVQNCEVSWWYLQALAVDGAEIVDAAERVKQQLTALVESWRQCQVEACKNLCEGQYYCTSRWGKRKLVRRLADEAFNLAQAVSILGGTLIW